METLDFALQMEIEGIEFYQQAAQKVTDPAAKNMLLSLVQDEKRHQQVILDLKKQNPAQLRGTPLKGVKNVFQQLADEERPFIDENDHLSRLLENALEIEAKSVDLYYQLASEADDLQQKQLWRALEDEEIQHEKLMRLTLEYINKPELVLENAEFLYYND
ncbi:MAG: hypothetical protein AMJ79_15610 [Phycisphaerae bacterium SM23_30]|nr:MAG: hypothetical protein AMJ79_15610 [Phycisphaerae bacterium SM23_30]